MIDSYTATCVIVGFLVIFGVLFPILDKIPRVKSVVSFRWTIVVIYSALCLGVIIDFEHLDTSVRFAVVIGGILLSALFMIVRSREKAAINGWQLPHTRTSIKHGDIQAELSVSPKTIHDIAKHVDASSNNPEYKRQRRKDLAELLNQSLQTNDFGDSEIPIVINTEENKKEK